MPRVYFLKELVNSQVYYSNVPKKSGKPIPFNHGADDMGWLALDTDTEAAEIAEIRQLIEDKKGGIFEVNYDRYETEKKRQPSSKIGSGSKGMPRLAEQRFDPFRSQAQAPNPAQRASVAGVLANAGVAVGNPAVPAMVPADSPKGLNGGTPAAPPAATFSPRRGGKAKVGK